MTEQQDSKLTNDNRHVDKENLRIIYGNLSAYGKTIVTFRFTVLGFYLAAVGLILGSTPSLGKYILLCVITISLYIIELRNRLLKNELAADAKQIEKKWKYKENNDNYYKQPDFTTIFGIIIKEEEGNKIEGYNSYNDERRVKNPKFGIPRLKCKITHSLALDLLYGSIFLYALINVIFHLLFLGL